VWLAFLDLARVSGLGGLVDRVYQGWADKSPRGLHLHCLCSHNVNGRPLAQRYELDTEGQKVFDAKGSPKVKSLIDVKAHGGGIITAPSYGSVHKSGLPYTRAIGGPATIAIITPDEFQELSFCARLFHEVEEKKREEETCHATSTPSGDRPGDIFNARGTWEEALPAGWGRVYQKNGTTGWRRPGKDRGISATTNHAGSNLFYCFSTSTSFESERGYSKFSVYALSHHNGDFGAAALALAAKEYTNNGNSSGAPESEWTDEEANAYYTQQERPPVEDEAPDPHWGDATEHEPPREDEPPEPEWSDYTEEAQSSRLPPKIVWQGLFLDVAKELGLYTWEVWLAIFGALSATAFRNLHAFYFSSHLYGCSYGLLINATGKGKELINNIVRDLLPDDYTVRTGIQSGPALIPLLTDEDLKNKTGRLSLRGRKVVLLATEWSRIVSVGGIEHSTLIEDLNDLHMRHWPWTFSRSHKTHSGGDICIAEPALTLIGTTTRKLFHPALTDRMIGSGAINRYLILPGSAEFQPYQGRSYKTDTIAGKLDHLKAYTWGCGRELKDLYSPEAWDAFDAFQEDFIVPLMRNPDTSEALSRIHLHLQHAACLYAWQAQAPLIELRHFEAAKAVTKTYYTFVTQLLEERTKAFEPTKIQEVETAMEKRAIDSLKKSPGLTRRELARKVSHGKGGYSAWARLIDGMMKAGAIYTKPDEKPERLYVLPGL
jgi:hypothetical protein